MGHVSGPSSDAWLSELASLDQLSGGRFRLGLTGSTETARRLGVKKVLPKPFTRAELLAAVRESLESAP